jgi:Phytanoyl-CoA dioxygenase (PhyH)
LRKAALFGSQIAALKRTPVGDAVRLIKATGNFLSGTASGLREFYGKGAISHGNWEKLLLAHCVSNGRLTSLLSPLFRALRPPRKAMPVTGLLGDFSVREQEKIVSDIRRDGFHVFSSLMPAEICDEIETFAKNTAAVTESNRSQSEPLQKYDPRHPLSRTYKIREIDTVQNAAMQKLMGDQAFAAIAEGYLNTQTSIGGVDLWWSALYGNEPGSDAAQLFHFDFDAPPAWLKLFVYVTDVGPDNGPHVYVKGTHKPGLAGARELRARGYERISDSEIEKVFGKDAPTEISGPRGTVFMADTRGFHKGKMPVRGDRLLAQMIYCSSLFNDHGTAARLPPKTDPALTLALKKVPHVYERFL